MSSYRDYENAQRALRYGAVEFLLKPFSLDEAYRALRKADAESGGTRERAANEDRLISRSGIRLAWRSFLIEIFFSMVNDHKLTKVTLSAVISNASFTLDNTTDYMKAGLKIDSLVATLNLFKFSSYEYEWHRVIITKYYRDPNDNRWIAVSTWGDRRSINYRTHFDAITSFLSLGGGFRYFK